MDLPICAVCEFMFDGPCRFGQPCNCAPYFPSTEPEKFDRVQQVFGAENVRNILNSLEDHQQRGSAVNALCYEAEARLNDPIYGYVGTGLALNNYLSNLKREIDSANNELAIIMDEDQESQLMRLPDVDAQRNVDEASGMRENDQGDVHRAAGASTSSGPSSEPSNRNQP